MAEYKKQHYVPKFYLRRFSNSPSLINLMNIPSKKVVLNAKLKTQAYEDYFYGSDLKFEKVLADLEKNIASLIAYTVTSKSPPPHYSEEHIALLYFTILQNSRTLYAAEMLDELTNQMFYEIMRKDPQVTQEMLENVRYGFEHPAQFTMGIASESFALTTDLHMKLILNESEQDFVCSDNPVVFYNKLFEHRTFVSNTGLQSKGLIIFFPLDPRAILLLYDSTTYKVGDKKKRSVPIVSIDDVRMLNCLQITNCNENIYFLDESYSSTLISEAYASERFRRAQRSKLEIHDLDHDGPSQLLQMRPEDLRIGLRLSFLSIQKKTKIWLVEFEKQSRQPVFIPRDIILVEKFEEYKALASQGSKHPLGFVGFLGES